MHNKPLFLVPLFILAAGLLASSCKTESKPRPKPIVVDTNAIKTIEDFEKVVNALVDEKHATINASTDNGRKDSALMAYIEATFDRKMQILAAVQASDPQSYIQWKKAEIDEDYLRQIYIEDACPAFAPYEEYKVWITKEYRATCDSLRKAGGVSRRDSIEAEYGRKLALAKRALDRAIPLIEDPCQ